ncbi:peptidylprolyl isomerase [Antarcticibacterium arcticum]|uniref:Peptidyl-prolyl cis-trans isomerase n=1 Tax=Antarcticibacterium arcticum TaxID=2585771 RepID=A0A5B8YI59_9FLAO|nr:peptidylprolyl isomerase [Antarcticibacterium arcticum]QED37301.1 peptidylprolyl isomerase [Antarcticibacterium arcticum]
MGRYFASIFYFLFLVFASCEDTEKSSKNTTQHTPTTAISGTDSIPDKAVNTTKDPSRKIETKTDEGKTLVQEELIPFLTQYGKENKENRVKIITRFGEIEVLLYNDTPLHRANFIYLVKKGYFNNTFFHRVAKGFVIQGGNSDNRVTSQKRNENGNYLIPGEFDTGHKHSRGAFSAAKYAEQNVSKASSPYEFFIVQSNRGAHHLDNDHTVFGRVTKGMDVVDVIAEQEVGEGEWPHRNIHIKMEIID